MSMPMFVPKSWPAAALPRIQKLQDYILTITCRNHTRHTEKRQRTLIAECNEIDTLTATRNDVETLELGSSE